MAGVVEKDLLQNMEGQRSTPTPAVAIAAKVVSPFSPIVGAILAIASYVGASPVHTSPAYEGGLTGSMEGGPASTGSGSPTGGGFGGALADAGLNPPSLADFLGGGGGGSGSGFKGQGQGGIAKVGGTNPLLGILGLLLLLLAIGLGIYYWQKGKK